MLGKNFGRCHFKISLIFFQKIGIDISFSFGDNLHEISNTIFWKKIQFVRVLNLPKAYKFVCVKVLPPSQPNVVMSSTNSLPAELQWLEHLWNHRKLFETWVVRDTEG